MGKKNKRKNRTLGRFIVKRYITFSIVLIILISAFLSLGTNFIYSNMGAYFSGANANGLTRPDYENIDSSKVQEMGGWVEVLNQENQVIFTHGEVLESKDSYTQEELLSYASFWDLIEPNSISIAGFLNITIKRTVLEEEKPEYLITTSYFDGEDGEAYLCLVKIPTEAVNIKTISFTLDHSSGELRSTMLVFALVTFGGVILIYLFYLGRYSKNIRRHLVRPNKLLVEGLQEITRGDYKKRITLEAEYEYREIEDSFNFMAQELEEARKKNKLYEQERQQLFSSIAHDLRTPVTSIRGCAKALEDGIVPSKEKEQEYLRTIVSKSERIGELMELLMVYTKMNHAQYQLRLEPVSYPEYVMEIGAEYYNDFEKSGMELDFEIAEEPMPVLIDQVELRRVIVNLLTNAMRHNPAGTAVRLALYRQEDQAVLEVWDNGPYIEEHLVSSIFRPFVLGDESRTSKNGSGLGLSICKKIVEKHRGSIVLVQENGAEEEGERQKCFRISLEIIREE